MRKLLALLLLLLAPALRAEINPEWTANLTPFQIADNLYYVGSRDLAAYLVTTPQGNILINSNLETSPPQIRASVEKLGFRWADTRILLNSQAHYDHMAGSAQILRETHARNLVMAGDVPAVESGGARDFTHNMDGMLIFPPSRVTEILHDGSVVTLGGVTLTAHLTAGHSRGCTTWTFQTHIPGEPAQTSRNVVIVGGYSALSDYRLVARPGKPTSYPGIAQDFQHTFATLRALPCDLFLGAHGIYFNMLNKLTRMPAEGPKVFLDNAGYQAMITSAQQDFEKELAAQQAKR